MLINAGRRTTVILAVLLCLLFPACKKPTDGLTLSVAPQLFEYTVALQFYNAVSPGTSPANISLKAEGNDAAGIYEISGNKKLTVVDGFISLGVLSDRNPAPGKPVSFLLQVTAPGYMPMTIPVKMVYGQKVQFVQVEMINLSTPPAGVSVKKTSISLTNNAVPAATNIITPLSQGKQESVSMTIPAGTQFKDEAGNILTGNMLAVTVLHFDARKAASLNAYPGGRRSSDLIKDSLGQTSSGYFQTAGFVYVQCSLDGKNVTGFTKNVAAVMDVSNQQWNPRAARNFNTGDVLPVFRFTLGTAVWTTTGTTTLSNSNGKLKAQFNMNRPSSFSLAFSGNVCAEPQLVFNTGLAEPEVFRVDVFSGDDEFTPVYSRLIQAADKEPVPFADLPSGTISLKVYPADVSNPLYDFFVHTQATGIFNGNACGGGGTITINNEDKEPLYFDIQGYCSNTKTYIRPTFYVLYALPGSDNFQLLGQVRNGRFSTRNLDVNTTYDFKVIWGGNRTSLITGKLADSPGDKITIIIPKTEEANFCP